MDEPADMFRDSNRVRFERPVDDTSRRWWREAFHAPHGLTPEGMGDLITRSVSTDKSILYRYIDGRAHSFALRVEGRFQNAGDIWFVERSLELDGAAFSADAMFIPQADAAHGRGRRLMGDLIQAADLLGLTRIGIKAERIGRYAWIRVGFVPDRASWRNIQFEAFRFVQRHLPSLGPDGPATLARIMEPDPLMARWLAALTTPVPSRELHDPNGQPLQMPFGKTFFLEASPNWTGQFTPDPDSRSTAREYLDA